MKTYKLVTTKEFSKTYKKLVKKNRSIADKVTEVLINISSDPFASNLKTHKVRTMV